MLDRPAAQIVRVEDGDRALTYSEPLGLWGYLNAVSQRRAKLAALRIQQPARPIFLTPHLLIAMILIGMFGWAFEISGNDQDTRKLMVGAMIAAFAGAWGYFLGSSNGAARANERLDTALDTANSAVLALPSAKPTAVLKPGETAQAAPANDTAADDGLPEYAR